MKTGMLFFIMLVSSSHLEAGVNKDATVSKFYKDLDYFKLEGVTELGMNETDHYPYFEIITVSSEKKIIRFIHDTILTEEWAYQRINDYWLNVRESKERLTHTFIYEYIFNDHILKLEYLYIPKFGKKKGSVCIPDDFSLKDKGDFTMKDHFLLSIGLVTRTKDEIYFYYDFNKEKTKVWIAPSPDLEQRMRSMKHFNHFVTTKEILADKVVEIEIIGPYNMENKRCYNLVDKWGYTHNVFWLTFFDAQVDCEN